MFQPHLHKPELEPTAGKPQYVRFLDVDSSSVFLADAGLTIEQQFGDWDRSPLMDTSPEIITVVRRSPTNRPTETHRSNG